MSTPIVQSVALAAALLAIAPASASEAWHLAPGEAGATFHPEHVRSTLTREQFLAQWAEERRAMAARGYRWDQLYGTYSFVGPGSRPTPTSGTTREQFLATEAEEKRQMRDKGMTWNQLFGMYLR